MSLIIGPNIVIDSSLNLYLDAANSSSYAGTGATTWYDLSGNGNNFTLNGSPAPTGSYIYFNGTSQYSICVNTTFGNFGTGSFTVEYAVRVKGYASGYATILQKRRGACCVSDSSRYGWYDKGAGSFFIQTQQSPSEYTTTDYQSITSSPTVQYITNTFTRNTGGTSNTLNSYINGVLQKSAASTFTSNTSVDYARSVYMMFNPDEGAYLQGDIYLVRAYTRDLSATEIQQNYNSFRSRYGI